MFAQSPAILLINEISAQSGLLIGGNLFDFLRDGSTASGGDVALTDRAIGIRSHVEIYAAILGCMADVTQILNQIERGDPAATEQLLPLVYDELRKLAAAKLVQEKSGQTLQATALVHEAYLRLVDVQRIQRWDSRGHFFAAVTCRRRRYANSNKPPMPSRATPEGSGTTARIMSKRKWRA
jgi:hypothetical protein